MTRLGFGWAGWIGVALVTFVNWYAFVPVLEGQAMLAVGMGIPVAAYFWVFFLKAVFGFVLGVGQASSAPDAPAES